MAQVGKGTQAELPQAEPSPAGDSASQRGGAEVVLRQGCHLTRELVTAGGVTPSQDVDTKEARDSPRHGFPVHSHRVKSGQGYP